MIIAKEIRKYEAYLKQCELSEETIKIYIREVERLLNYLDGGIITKTSMMDYKKKLCMSNRKIATINLSIVSINKYLKYVGYSNCMLKTEKVQRNTSLHNILNLSEYRTMMSCAKQNKEKKYYYLMRTLALTGVRVSEVQFFKVETLVDGTLTVKNKGKSREVYLPDKLIEELKTYCDQKQIHEGVIFRGATNNPLSRSAIYKGLIHIAVLAGVSKEKAHPHSFRHLFALTYMKQYSNISELADILGHSSIETTRIYTLTTVEEKRKKLNLLNL